MLLSLSSFLFSTKYESIKLEMIPKLKLNFGWVASFTTRYKGNNGHSANIYIGAYISFQKGYRFQNMMVMQHAMQHVRLENGGLPWQLPSGFEIVSLVVVKRNATILI